MLSTAPRVTDGLFSALVRNPWNLSFDFSSIPHTQVLESSLWFCSSTPPRAITTFMTAALLSFVGISRRSLATELLGFPSLVPTVQPPAAPTAPHLLPYRAASPVTWLHHLLFSLLFLLLPLLFLNVEYILPDIFSLPCSFPDVKGDLVSLSFPGSSPGLAYLKLRYSSYLYPVLFPPQWHLAHTASPFTSHIVPSPSIIT